MTKNQKDNYILYNGESLAILKSLPSDSVDMVLSDLPYGTTQNLWDSIIPLKELFEQYVRICKKNAPIVLFGAMPFTAELVVAGRDLFKYGLVWKKNKVTGHLNAKKRHMRQHEDILVFCRGVPVYYPQKTSGHKPMNLAINESKANEDKLSTNYGKVKPTRSNAGSTERYPTSILEFDVVNNDDPARIHPTQKPIPLLENLIKTFSLQGDVVLDNAMGSGTAGVASVNLERSFIGIERDPLYYQHAKKWIEDEVKKQKK